MRAVLSMLVLSTGCSHLVTTSAEDPRLDKIDVRAAAGYGRRVGVDDRHGRIAVEASVTTRFGLREEEVGRWTPTLLPEAGYIGSFPRQGDANDHFFNLGLGFGFTYDQLFTIGIVPGAMFGSANSNHARPIEQTAFGLRGALILEIIHILGVQASYGAVFLEDGPNQSLQITGSVNLIPVFVALYVLGSS